MRANLSETRPRSTARLRRNRPGPRLAAGPVRGGRPAEPAGNRALARLLGDGALQAKLEVDTPGDRWEREADRVADRIVGGSAAWGGAPAGGEAGGRGARPGLQRMCTECREEEEEEGGGGGAPPTVQRQCAECEEESLQTKERPGRRPRPASPPGSAAAGTGRRALRGGGEPLPAATRSFFEGRFGRGFGDVRIHRSTTAAGAATALGARAFTVGRDIAFGAGEYAPGTARGRHLLAHELTHVVQQSGGEPRASAAPVRIQRAIHRGHDNGGTYTLDDATCTLTYLQRWYFTFQTDQTPAERLRYMEAARLQIEDVWSEKHPLIPEDESCPCHPDGIRVAVEMRAREGERRGRGFAVTVTPTARVGHLDPPTRTVDLGTQHDQPVSFEGGLSQRTVAHEFGHSLDLTDEYNSWAELFFPTASRDRPSIMHSGDEVRPRHYQHFADLVNLELGPSCTYWPSGVRQPSFENPVERWSSIPFTFLAGRSDFVLGLMADRDLEATPGLGLQYDRRVSNDPFLGLFYPTAGVMTLWDPAVRSVALGPTAGLRLSQIAHPLFVDVRTGVLFDPEDPESTVGISIPLALEVGMRSERFEIGVNYTPIVNVLGAGGWTHLVGVGGRFELPWERRR